MKNWKTIYECKCGELYENGVGKWDTRFFLYPQLCYKCGESNQNFYRKGVAYKEWRPKLFNWFNWVYVYKIND